MDENGGFTKYIVIVAIILVVVFMSQQPQFRVIGQKAYQKATQATYWTKAEDWIKNSLWLKVSGEAANIKASTTQEITKQKNNLVENLWEQLKSYFAAKLSNMFGTPVK